MSPQHVGDLLEAFFRRRGIKKAVDRARAVTLWPRVAGADVARFTRARSLKGGVLYVEVPDSETGMHLSYQRRRFLQVYAERFGVREVREIRFRSGLRPDDEAGEAQPPPETETRTEPDPEAWSHLAASLGRLDLPESVATPALRAGRAYLALQRRRREQGWRPCPHCGALTPDGSACDACARYRHEPAVLRASEKMLVNPGAATPDLTEEQRTVARAQARERLDAELLELLPHVVAEPRLRGQLEQAARCRLALERDVSPQDVGPEDWQRLDVRVARTLGLGPHRPSPDEEDVP